MNAMNAMNQIFQQIADRLEGGAADEGNKMLNVLNDENRQSFADWLFETNQSYILNYLED